MGFSIKYRFTISHIYYIIIYKINYQVKKRSILLWQITKILTSKNYIFLYILL